MKKKRVLLICVMAAVLGLIVLFALGPTSHEPSYGGHHLSYWVAILGRSSPAPAYYENKRAINAVDHVGVVAVPFLLKWIQEDTPRWRVSLGWLLYQTRLPIARRLAEWVAPPSSSLAAGVPLAFRALGQKAMPAFDDLCGLMNATNNPLMAMRAAESLSCFGTNALPPLLAVATNTKHQAQLHALSAIGEMSGLDTAGQITVASAITNFLATTNNPTVQIIAIGALADLKAAPEISVPALVSALKSRNAKLRLFSAAALGAFGGAATNAIPALTNAITDSDPLVRFNATFSLHNIDSATFSAPQ